MADLRNIFRAATDADDALPGDADVDELLRDPALAALADELGALGDVRVPPSARQRGLALVHEELDRQERRGFFGSARRGGLLFRGRLALGSVAIVLAAFLGLVGLYGGGDAPQWTGSADSTGSGTGSVTTDTPAPDGSGSTATSGSLPGTTDTSVVGTTLQEGTTVPTGAPSTAPSSTATSAPPSTGSTKPPSPSTTGPATTSTTNRAVFTREQRESSASSLALYLSNQVIAGDLDAAGAALAGSAGAGFVQLVASLEAPYGAKIISVSVTDGPNTLVLVEFLDRVPGDDGPVEVAKRFSYEIRVEASGALVTAIYKAPAR